MKLSNTTVGLLVSVALSTSLLASTAMAGSSKPLTNAELREMQQMILREKDAREVENLMSRRSQLQVLGSQEPVFDLYSKKQPDISWTSNNGSQSGQENMKKFFGIGDTTRAQRSLEAAIKIYPDLENKPENYNVGSYSVHALFDPIIVVADDGQTAKGAWHTFGPMINSRDGKTTGTMIWEKYFVDFIKEDGQWRLWHVTTYTDFSIQMGQTLDQKMTAASAQPQGGPPPGAPTAPVKPSYEEWSPRRVPKAIPLPVPYKTFSETFSYGPSPAK